MLKLYLSSILRLLEHDKEIDAVDWDIHCQQYTRRICIMHLYVCLDICVGRRRGATHLSLSSARMPNSSADILTWTVREHRSASALVHDAKRRSSNLQRSLHHNHHRNRHHHFHLRPSKETAFLASKLKFQVLPQRPGTDTYVARTIIYFVEADWKVAPLSNVLVVVSAFRFLDDVLSR